MTPKLMEMYEKWRLTVNEPDVMAGFYGGFVAGSWYMRETILKLPIIAANPMIVAQIEDVLDVPR
jgi:hypothetical protein